MLPENYLLLGTDNVLGQLSEDILYSVSFQMETSVKKFKWKRSSNDNWSNNEIPCNKLKI